jgi:hypothetical protein
MPDPGRAPYQWREDKKLNASQEATWRRVSVEAQGRLLLAVCALVGRREGASGPDIARRITDPETALQVMDSAGYSARQLAGTWKADQPAPAPAQRSSSWSSSPDHDERVTRALLHGAPDHELAAIRAEVAAEYAHRAMAKQRRDDEFYGRDRPAAIGVSQGPDGAPVQRSTVFRDTPELGSEA